MRKIGWEDGREEGRKVAASVWLLNSVMSDVAMAWSMMMVMMMVNFHSGNAKTGLREI